MIGLGGCAGWNYRGDGFKENELSTTARQARSQDSGNANTTTPYWSFDEKGRQIERDLNVQ